MGSNAVRIIGGKWRGRKLVFPDRPDLRPTLGRVRETLFNWLRADIDGSRCLDLFAGSGALGFEALSRGAAKVVFVDSDRRAVRSLEDNAARLEAGDGATVICGRAERVLRSNAEPSDVIFVDPPFAAADLVTVLEQIRTSGALKATGLVYFEGPRRVAIDTAGWREIKHATAGDAQFGLLATP